MRLSESDDQFILYPSRYFMGMLLLLHVAAMTAILTLPLSWWAYLLIAVVLMCSLYYYITKYIYFKFRFSIKQFQYLDNNDWQLKQKNGNVLQATLEGDSVVTSFLCVLNFNIRKDGLFSSKRSIIVFKDSLQNPGFRRLRLICVNCKIKEKNKF